MKDDLLLVTPISAVTAHETAAPANPDWPYKTIDIIMGNKKNRRKESPLHQKKRCKKANAVRAALNPALGSYTSRNKTLIATTNQLRIGAEMGGIQITSIPVVFVINIESRADRWELFNARANSAGLHRDTEIVRVQAAEPSHHMLQKGGEFGAPAKAAVADSIPKQNKCRACVLSHILALKQVENRNITPALICEDDLILTKEGALRQVPLPALAAAVSVGHDPAVTVDAPVAYEWGSKGESLVAVREGGFKSSSAGYLIPTRAKAQAIRKQLEKELREGLCAPMDALLFHPRLLPHQQKSVYLTKLPLFTQDMQSWSNIESKYY